MVNFVLKKRGRTIVPEDKIGQLDLSGQRELLGNSLSGEQTGKATSLQSEELLGRRTRDAQGEIKPILQGMLKEQRNLHDPSTVRSCRQLFPPNPKQDGVSERF